MFAQTLKRLKTAFNALETCIAFFERPGGGVKLHTIRP
jgi:hypothetical protein